MIVKFSAMPMEKAVCYRPSGKCLATACIKPQLFELLQKEQDDKISRIIRNDQLLVTLGKADYMRLGHDPEQQNTI